MEVCLRIYVGKKILKYVPVKRPPPRPSIARHVSWPRIQTNRETMRPFGNEAKSKTCHNPLRTTKMIGAEREVSYRFISLLLANLHRLHDTHPRRSSIFVCFALVCFIYG